MTTPDFAVAPPRAAKTAHLDIVKDHASLSQVALGDHGTRALTMGRSSAQSDVVCDHPSVSRCHLSLVWSSDLTLYVIDLGSAHGTFLGLSWPVWGSGRRGDQLSILLPHHASISIRGPLQTASL